MSKRTLNPEDIEFLRLVECGNRLQTDTSIETLQRIMDWIYYARECANIVSLWDQGLLDIVWEDGEPRFSPTAMGRRVAAVIRDEEQGA